MPTLLVVFRGKDDTETVLDRLSAHGIDRGEIGLVWREKTIRRAEDVEVSTYVDHFDGPGAEAKKGALGGVIGGATAGAGSVLLAAAGVTIGPGIATLLGVPFGVAAAAAAVAGAAGGGVSGGIIGALLGAADNDATKVNSTETQFHDYTEIDGFVISFDIPDVRNEELVTVLQDAGADDITVLGVQGRHLRTLLN